MSATRTPHHRRKTKIHRRPKKGPESINWNNIKAGLSLSLSPVSVVVVVAYVVVVYLHFKMDGTQRQEQKNRRKIQKDEQEEEDEDLAAFHILSTQARSFA